MLSKSDELLLQSEMSTGMCTMIRSIILKQTNQHFFHFLLLNYFPSSGTAYVERSAPWVLVLDRKSVKVFFTVVFVSNDVLLQKFLPEGHTANKEYGLCITIMCQITHQFLFSASIPSFSRFGSLWIFLISKTKETKEALPQLMR